MVIDLQREHIQWSEKLAGNVAEAVVDADIIVPDIKPDVADVLQVDATAFVGESYVQKDHVTVSGSVSYQILYLSDRTEEEQRLKSITYDMPFSHQVEVRGVDDTALVSVSADVVHVEFGVVNSRKINVKTVVELNVDAVKNAGVGMVCGVSGECDMPCRTGEVHTLNMIACTEEEFEVGDALCVPAGSPMMDELLKVDVRVDGKEVKVVNGKILAKGKVNVCALYVGANREICSMEHEIPFTEVLDVTEADPDMITDVDYRLKNVDYKIAQDNDGDATLLDFRVRIAALTRIWNTQWVTAVTDLYCPDYEVGLSRTAVPVERVTDTSVSQCIIKEDISLPPDAPGMMRIYNVIAKPYIRRVELENHKVTVEGEIDTYLLYLSSSADCPVYSHQKQIPFTHFAEAPSSENGATPDVRVNVDHINYSFHSATDAQVRMVVSVDTRVTGTGTVDVVADVTADEECRFDHKNQASIVIYFVQKGDSLWEIAKRYHTTVEAIAGVNRLDPDGIITPGMQLLIPKRR
ncbi:MAG: DUF3794 domain-containing protein [Ruminococcaceae bacterium]|nr:DUF3794 domain-containing protein [Oscillospiraceae bacterium]